MFQSSTTAVPDVNHVPSHIAMIMDGNGRWAKQRYLPRTAGHYQGAKAVREIVAACAARGVRYLTLFAFSSENWRRPAEEVSILMQLFMRMLKGEVSKMQENGVCLKVIGDLSRFSPELQALIAQAQADTAHNSTLVLTIAANYGGRWDIMQAMRQMLAAQPARAQQFEEADLTPYLSLAYAPEPDLFIRTGGEARVSNFLLWQLAYTEFYFTPTLWPDFDPAALDVALDSYRSRERRFGRTSEQVQAAR